MNIKEAREFAGLTQKQVEEEFGVPVRTLQNWETDTRQPPEYVEASLVEKLCQMKKVARIKVIPERLEVIVEVLMDGEWELCSSAPIQDEKIPVSILIDIGRYYQGGYKLIFM